MKILVLIVLVHFTLSTNSYFGIRVAKSLGSVLRDNLQLARDESKKLTGTQIKNITAINSDWWINIALSFVDINITQFNFREQDLELKSYDVTPEGVLEVHTEGKGLHWLINFQWKLKILFITIRGTVELEVVSNKLTFRQEYKKDKINSDLKAGWDVVRLEYKGMNIELIKDWVKRVVDDKLIEQLSVVLNKSLNSISSELLKPYNRITINDKEGAVKIENKLLSGNRGFHKERTFIVMDFGAEISATNKQYKHKVETGLLTSFNSTEEKFDYEVCYSSRLFGEYMYFLVKAGYKVFDDVNIAAYHKYVGFYKRILNSLGNQYPDDEEVLITLEGNTNKTFSYLTPDIFYIPIVFKFTTNSDKKLALTFDATFKYQYEITETKDRHITATLRKGNVHRLETVPSVGYQSRFAASELAESFAWMVVNKTIAEPDGFFVDTVRPNSYKLNKIERRPEETCYLYSDNEA